MTNLHEKSLEFHVDDRLKYLFKIRNNSKSWVFFAKVIKGNILGYGFLHIPASIEWNDSLPTCHGEARVSSVFVYPEHRGKGIRGEIFNAQNLYASKLRLKTWSVIEEKNDSSMRAALKTGFIDRKNYLLKFFGINIFSILSNPFRIHLLTGKKRARR